MDLLRGQGRMFQQAGPQMCQVTIRIAGRGDAFVYLKDMDVLPGNVFVSEVDAA